MPDDSVFFPHLIYVAGSDGERREQLARAIREYGFQASAHADAPSFATACGEMPPDATVLDLREGEDSLLEEIAGQSRWPLLVISEQDDIAQRLKAVRHNVQAFFHRSASISHVVERLEVATVRHEADPYRVLIVDDEPAMGEIHRAILESANFSARVISSEDQLLSTLTLFDPELVLMDLYLENCLGSELATVIRQFTGNPTLPLVYVSSEEDHSRQLSAIRAGGDDFLLKPIFPDDLLASVIPLVKRFRNVRKLLHQDRLTGTLRFYNLFEQLESEIANARDKEQPLAFILFDIDHLREVNFAYGAQGGDLVIENLVLLIRSKLPKRVKVGRFNGDCYGAILPDTDAETAHALADDLCAAFAALTHQISDTPLHLSVTAGVGHFPNAPDRRTLVEAAMNSLELAKRRSPNAPP